MSLISLVSVIARTGEYKNYSRDEIKYWRYTSYKGWKLPEGFTDEKFFQRHLQRKNIYNETFTYPDVISGGSVHGL